MCPHQVSVCTVYILFLQHNQKNFEATNHSISNVVKKILFLDELCECIMI